MKKRFSSFAYTKVIKVAKSAATPANVTTTLPNRVPVPLGSENSAIVLVRVLLNEKRGFVECYQ